MKVLLLDTAFSAAPIYDYLVGCGHDTWVMGNRAGDVLARRAGGRWIEQDYSRVDDVRAHVDRIGFDRLVPGCTDVSMDTCIRLGGAWLDAPDANAMLADKERFRALCLELDLPAPRAVRAERIPPEGKFICKPVDAFSGRGISVFDGSDSNAAAAALDLARRTSPSGRALVEPFVEGALHSYTTFIEAGQPTDGFFVREGSSINRFAVDTSYVVDDMPESCRSTLAAAVAKVARCLDLRDGLVHTQFLWDGRAPSIVEMSRRCPGDLYALLIEYSTGYRYASRYAAYFLGAPCDAAAARPRHVLRHTVTADAPGIYGGLRLTEGLPVRAFYPLLPLGADIAGGHAGRAGILFCDFPDREGMLAAERLFLARKAYSVN
jgi:hypothetical protein